MAHRLLTMMATLSNGAQVLLTSLWPQVLDILSYMLECGIGVINMAI